MSPLGSPRCSFVPPYLLARIAETAADPTARHTLAVDQNLRARRQAMVLPRHAERVASEGAEAGGFTVHSADNSSTLPGRAVRSAGDPESDDLAVDEAWEGVRGSLEMFAQIYEWISYDGAGATVLATVHYERDYDNAFWDGQHLVFGDGDGRLFDRFTKPIDIGAHEFTHAVTEHTAGLVYRDQPGALNESVSDVFAACLKQRLLGQTASEGDWLIGEGLFLPGVQGRALRSMSQPGSAYDDPVLGRDPQPGHMDDFIVTSDDNGGVHLNSGIPNRAFHLAATAIGGSAAEGAGRIWFAALRAASSTTEFAEFAEATVTAAGEHAELVAGAWAEVGVAVGAAGGAGDSAPPPAPNQPPTQEDRAMRRVAVRRTGGFAGRTVSGEVDLGADDPRAAEVRSLVERVDLRAGRATAGHPDAFVYAVEIDDQPAVTFDQSGLTGDLRRLVDVVLADPDQWGETH